ncbi:MAG: 4'-phosphopantetheinyl transferase family protein [Steroidobacteraceae bacterium]
MQIADLDHHGSDEAAAQILGHAFPPQLARAVPTRRIEFLAGRLCAQRALEQAGYAGNAVIPIGERRAPVWPSGFTGSIAHGNGTAWAVVASQVGYRGLGIDLEKTVAFATARRLSNSVLSPREREHARPAALSEEQFLGLVFSAKESLFKCLHPITPARLDFQDAELVHLDLDAKRLRLSLRAALSPEIGMGSVFDVAFDLGPELRTGTFVPAAA